MASQITTIVSTRVLKDVADRMDTVAKLMTAELRKTLPGAEASVSTVQKQCIEGHLPMLEKKYRIKTKSTK